MGRLSRSLSRYEVACPCCGVDTHDVEQVQALQDCVDYFQALYPSYDVGIHINSGNRCVKYNASIPGASKDSQHTQYRADDFFLYDKNSGDYKTGVRIHDDEVADYLEKRYPGKYGIGRYKGRTHLDSRAVKARWDRR